MFELCEAVREQIDPIKIIDVGAMILEGGQGVPYQSLLDKNLAVVIGFEPIEEERARLHAADASGRRKYLPHVVGNGKPGVFHQCSQNMTSSLYKPNKAMLDRFTGLTELVEVVKSEPVATHRLDYFSEVRDSDYLKLDVQGAELDVIRGAKEVLKDVLVVETEVEFVPLYENQPLFGDIDVAMREAGFLLHRFADLQVQTLRPLLSKAPPAARGRLRMGQILWGDAVYVKNFLGLRDLSVTKLLKFAVIMEMIYGSRDFTLLALQVAEELGGPKLWDEYCFESHEGCEGTPASTLSGTALSDAALRPEQLS